MNEEPLRFLADESCDFAVVRSLREAGFDVLAVSESFPAAPDQTVLKRAADECRILLTEDKDFGEWVFARGHGSFGVLFIRYPAHLRSNLGRAVIVLVIDHGSNLSGNFTVMEPGRARIRKM